MSEVLAEGKARHVASMRVSFGDVDHAGILYYPRIFHYAHKAYEEWLDTQPNWQLPELFRTHRVGTPVVTAEATFHGPLAHGEKVDVEVVVEKVGTRSFTLGFRLCDRETNTIRARVRVVHAMVSMDTFSSVAIPDGLRVVLEGPKKGKPKRKAQTS